MYKNRQFIVMLQISCKWYYSGSCLGPLLFVIYINDVVKLFDQDCVCKLYADDLKLYMHMNLPNCDSRLQHCLDKLADWSCTWQLSISHKKCAIMRVGNTKTSYQFNLMSNPIASVSVVRDLGVFIDDSANFSSHIHHIVTRAFARANLMFSIKGNLHSDSGISCLCATVSRDASVVWSPYL